MLDNCWHKVCVIDKAIIITLGVVLLLISLVFPVIVSAAAKIIVSVIGAIIIVWAIFKPCSHNVECRDNDKKECKIE